MRDTVPRLARTRLLLTELLQAPTGERKPPRRQDAKKKTARDPLRRAASGTQESLGALGVLAFQYCFSASSTRIWT
jgi:hypothetical protein